MFRGLAAWRARDCGDLKARLQMGQRRDDDWCGGEVLMASERESESGTVAKRWGTASSVRVMMGEGEVGQGIYWK